MAFFLLECFLCFFSSAVSARAESALPAVDAQWRALLYLTTDDAGENPAAELQQFLTALRAPISLGDEHASCRFPARLRWLEQMAPEYVRELRLPACPRLETWLKQIDADRAYLLFAAQFMNSPASMYGHTLLQLGRRGPTKGEAILDYVVAYGAESGDSSGLAYLIKGLAGGFRGRFSTLPYYLKIREYNDAESRDIWSYELKLSSAQVAMLVRHVWEIRDREYPYYFLGKNCSYLLLRLLDVVHSGESVTKDLPAWTIPTDTIRALRRAGWIGERSRRPARSAWLLARRSLLSATERSFAKHYGELDEQERGNHNTELASLRPERAALVLDTAYDLFRYRQGGKVLSDSQMARERSLLAQRSRLPKQDLLSVLPRLPPEEPPDDSHLSNRIAVLGGVEDRKAAMPRSILEVEWRPAIQDLLSNPFGLDHYGEQEVLRTNIRFENKPRGSVVLQNFEVLRIRALQPLDPWMLKPSWRFRLGSTRNLATNCVAWNCFIGRLEGGIGASLGLFGDSESALFFLGTLIHQVGPGISDRGWRLGLGPEFGVKLKIFSWFRVLAEGDWPYFWAGKRGWEHEYRLALAFAVNSTEEIRLLAEARQENHAFRLGFFHFF